MPSWSRSRPSAELSALAPEERRAPAELGLLALLALAVLAWFGGFPSLGVSAPLAAVAVLGAFVCAWWTLRPLPRPAPGAETPAVPALALAYRLPALLPPLGWGHTDGAYRAFLPPRPLPGA